MLRSFKYRIYPTKTQKAELAEMLGTFCWLYNRALEERRDGWRNYGWSFTYFQQSNGLKYWRAKDSRLGKFSFSAELRVLRRLDHAFRAFFRRVKQGQTPGFPRFRSVARFDTADFVVGDGLALKKGRARVVGISSTLKIKWHRELPAKPKAASIRREGSRWFVIFLAEVAESRDETRPYTPVGIDAGLASLVTMTTDEAVPTPQWTARAAKRIRRNNRALMRAKKGSTRRRKARERLAEAHRKASRQRRDFLHKLSRRIVAAHSHIAIEDLTVANMARSRLAKSIHNAAWATLRNMLTYKAEEAGSVIMAVRPHGTSQTCSGCGCDVPKKLSVRTHDCPHCGLVLDRDLNAARNILARANFPPGTGGQDISQPVAA